VADKMDDTRKYSAPDVDPAFGGLSTRELLGKITEDVTALARKEIELARAEMQSHLSSLKVLAGTLGVAAIFALGAVNMLFVTVAMAFVPGLPPWGAALLMTGILLVLAGIAAAIGWSKRVRNPLGQTRRTVKEDVRWMKQRLA
jgi:uncharacterized membrane protein YqjE